jgi:hypothetical protein
MYISDITDIAYSYYKKLINNKVIENNKIYDLNKISFQKKLSKYKTHYENVIFSDKTKSLIQEKGVFYYAENCNNYNKIYHFFDVDCVINKKYSGSLHDSNTIQIITKYYQEVKLEIYEINKKYYDYLYLREFNVICLLMSS